MNLDDYPELLTVKETMCILNIGKNLCYQLINNGTIPHVQLGKSFRIPKKVLIEKYLNFNENTNGCFTST